MRVLLPILQLVGHPLFLPVSHRTPLLKEFVAGFACVFHELAEQLEVFAFSSSIIFEFGTLKVAFKL